MEGVDIPPATLLQSRSPSLDLDSLYGNGPAGSRLGEVLRGRRDSPQARRGGGRPARLRPAAQDERARIGEAIIPDPRNDENLAVAQIHCAFIRFHNRVVDTLGAVPAPQRFRAGAQDRHEALPVDDPARTTCRGSATRRS